MEEETVWIQQALAGDHQAFARLVEAYQIPVYNLTYRMLGNAKEAEDAAQETFLRAYTRLVTYQTDKKFSSWLLAIASHYCIDLLRRRRFTWLSLDELPFLDQAAAERNQPEEAAIRREERDEVRQMLAQLPPQYRAAVILRYWYELSYLEIAEVMGTTESAIKSRLYRAREMLAQQAMASQTVETAPKTQKGERNHLPGGGGKGPSPLVPICALDGVDTRRSERR
ncbi:MAG: sigma-70 family RNA polymerase sigma factor [Anaerolineae bacterium]|nr:sigma-70 family RNA polymerase sigma factor [Anaerolineae bacterium]